MDRPVLAAELQLLYADAEVRADVHPELEAASESNEEAELLKLHLSGANSADFGRCLYEAASAEEGEESCAASGAIHNSSN